MNTAARPAGAVRAALTEVAPAAPPRLRLDSWRPYIGIFGVLLGSIMGTLGSRTTSFGLADIRGGVHAGFDEGAWITTSFGVGQMLIGVAAPYLGAVFGVRRVLLVGITLFFLASLLTPLTTDLHLFLALLVLGGVGSGTFIPLTVSFVIRSLPARLVIFGLAAYAMNSELSQNVAASLEGFYADNLSWRWIYWQYCLPLLAMFVAIWLGAPREPVNAALLKQFDWPGLIFASVGFAMLYAGLDQGNRLDWTSDGLVVGLLVGGGLLAAGFLLRELRSTRPFLNLRLLLHSNLVLLLATLAGFRFIILSTAFIIPTYLQVIQNFRELQIGQVLLWIALPQLVIVVPLGFLLRRIDGRLVLAFGAALIAVACLMTTAVTPAWATSDFLPSQVLQAFGQSFALTALIVLLVRCIVPAEALTIGCLLQLSRLFGGEIGTAFMQTFVRVREQVHANLIGLHVASGVGLTTDRLDAYAHTLGAHVSDSSLMNAQASKLLASAVTSQASVLAYRDGFLAAALGAVVCLLLIAVIRPGRAASF